ncbi:MAG TPA: glycosyltransferase family 1 protein [Vicinamibacteria bacterium]|nr:glycosyltransferase family 1 protein [Vicinamibacteria bacterium]
MSSPLVIGIDFRPALSRATGVGRYFQGLVSGLVSVDGENHYVLFSSSLKERPRVESRPPNFELVDRRFPVRALNAAWHRVGFPPLDWVTGRSIDVAHSPTPLLLPSVRGRSVVTICDLFFLDHPEATSREIRRDYASLIRSHVRRADAVLAISETTASDVMRRLDVSPERLFIVHAGVDEGFLNRSEENFEGERPYLLMVATEDPRKNVTTLLEALARLKERGFDGSLKIAGSPGLDTPRILDRIENLGLAGMVERLGYVESSELPNLYRGARCLVAPSLWEGFGLPLLEAMASGTPAVASEIPVHREVAGDAALYYPPEDPSALAQAIERVWLDEALRGQLIDGGVRRASRFSWAASARKALAMYRSLV